MAGDEAGRLLLFYNCPRGIDNAEQQCDNMITQPAMTMSFDAWAAIHSTAEAKPLFSIEETGSGSHLCVSPRFIVSMVVANATTP